MLKLVEELKGKLARATEDTLSAEEKNKLLDAAVLAEEKRQESMKMEISQISALKRKGFDELGEMKLHKRHFDTEIQVAHAPTTVGTGPTAFELGDR